MKAPRVFITRPVLQPGVDFVKRRIRGVTMNREDRVLPRGELLRRVRGMHGIYCLLHDRMDAELMDAAGPQLRVISNMAVGYDNVDVAEATRRGILVCNTPGVLTETTAEMAWALLFAAARRLPESDRYTRGGRFKCWGPQLLLGRDISGKTLGVVGAGRIGAAFARMSRGFRMNVLYSSRSRNAALEKELNARRVPLDALLRRSDFVSLHVALTPQTRHLIGARELNLMKRSAILINTARGPVVDEKALVRALRRRRIAAAGLDVYEREPRLEPGLKELDNAVLAPHTASATVDTRTRMALMAAENLVLALQGKKPASCVNPEVLKR